MRLVEIGLFLLPLACWLIWLRLSRRPGPAPIVVAVLATGLLGLGALLVWFALTEGAPPGAVYHPARLENGRIVPGTAVAR